MDDDALNGPDQIGVTNVATDAQAGAAKMLARLANKHGCTLVIRDGKLSGTCPDLDRHAAEIPGMRLALEAAGLRDYRPGRPKKKTGRDFGRTP